MKKSALIIGAVTVFISIGLSVILLGHAAEPRIAVALQHARGDNDASLASGDQAADLREEVQRLRAEVRMKNELLRVIVAQPRVQEKQQDPAPVATQTTHVDRIAQVCDALDERIMMAHSDTADARAMQRALQEVSGALGQTRVTSLLCSGKLCKVALAGESDATVGASAASMAERAPKMFAASMAYPAKPGETAMYLAKSHQDLAVDLDDDAWNESAPITK